MVNLVNVFIQRTPVEGTMEPIVVHVLEDEKECDLGEHERNRRKRDLVSRHAEETADRVEDEDDWQFAGEVCDQHDLSALPYLGSCDVFVLK